MSKESRSHRPAALLPSSPHEQTSSTSKFTESKPSRLAALFPSSPRSQTSSMSKSTESKSHRPRTSPHSQTAPMSKELKSHRSAASLATSPLSPAASMAKELRSQRSAAMLTTSPLSPAATTESKSHRSRPPSTPSSRPRSLSSSTGTSAPRHWPPRISGMETPWTTPSNSWPTIGYSPRDQCLRSTALLGKILSHIEPGTDPRSLKAQRQSLLWIALTCKTISPTAIKYLYRRLDNLLPLLHLLPSFTKRNSKYGLFGAPNPNEWQSFDRHAAFVREVVYEDVPKTIQIDAAVYLRLFLRNATILPHLERFVCKTSVRPSESEILVYLRSPLHTLELGTFEPGTLYGGDTGKMAATREAVVSSLSTNPSHISHLILFDQPFSVLAEGIPLQNLTSLEFRAMYGVMDAGLLRQIGSLPHLRSLTADSGCFTGLNLSNIATRLTGTGRVTGSNASQQHEHSGLFAQLTYLELERHPSLPHATISSFLQLIGSPRLRSLLLTVRPARKVARAGAKDGKSPADLQADPLFTIAQRWSRSLRYLHLELDHNYHTVANFLRHVTVLRHLELGGFLQIPDDADVCSLFSHLPELEILKVAVKTGADPPAPIPLDIRAMTRLVRSCPRLRELKMAISVPTIAPPSSTWPISQALKVIAVHHSDRIVNTVAFARYLDRLFPKLNSVRYTDDRPENEAEKAQWEQVQELVFAFQDVRLGV